MALTIYDIAREAGVSITSVSRVLNNKGEISGATRAKVQAVLDRSGYVPNQIARGLASRSSKTVGVIAFDLRVEHHALLVHHAEAACDAAGYSCMVCSLGGNPDRFADCLENLSRRQADGVLLTGSMFEDAPYASLLKECKIPYVILNGIRQGKQCAGVLNEEEEAFRAAVHFLAEKRGRKNIFWLGPAETASDRRKLTGFRAGLQELGFPAEGHSLECGRGFEDGSTAGKELLRAFPQMDAVLCPVDAVAVGFLHATQMLGVRVPGQLMVVGSDNSLLAQASLPSLSSIDVDPEKTAWAAVELLIACMNRGKVPQQVLIPCRLVERESTAASIN